MKNNNLIRAVFILAVFMLTACQPGAPLPTQTLLSPAIQPSPAVEPADLVLTNGFIYTVDRNRTVAEAMAVRGDSIVYVGDRAGAHQLIGPQTRVFDLEGKLVLPGLIDSHAHAASGVSDIYEVSLSEAGSLEGYQKAIAAFRSKTPDLKALLGGGWINSVFDSKGPTAAMLDAAVSDIPALLYSQDYHSAWVNTKALELAGITKDTPDPAGGLIERDQDGKPLGTLREAAVQLAVQVIPPYTSEQYLNGLAYFQDFAHSLGLTTVYIPSLLKDDEAGLKALHDFEASGKMTIRYPTGIKVPPEADRSVVEALAARRAAEAGGYFEIVAAKIFMDGVLESGTAYLEQPYLQQAGNGQLQWDVQKYNAMCAALDQAGIQIHVHSIGDAATRITLDGFAYARQHNGVRDARNMITHLQFVHKEDIARFADLGVIAVPQPYWFARDKYYYPQAVTYVGQERADAQYPMNSFFEKGVRVASGSDYPVTRPPNPMLAIEIGARRTAPLGSSYAAGSDFETPLNPSEKVSVEQLIESFTIHGAYALFKEDQLGSLEVGRKADFIVLSQNILKIPQSEIHNTTVLLTFFEGQEVYRSKDYKK